ncbi:MAG: ABC transporter ATP-binding protein [Wenzhouxiangella sp.]|nr:ABC transporter ATP-binding protein [Wenzhouxiangella sp.]
MSGAPILQLQDLETVFDTRQGLVRAVNQVSLDVAEGEIVGLVGESGSGKSVTGFSILGLIDPPGRIAGGQIRFRGTNLLDLDETELRRLRGREIAMIFQDPMMTLNPVLRIDTQIVEAILAHERIPHSQARQSALEALGEVGIPSPEERLRAYPHQLSGGMRQRVAIAIALINRPAVLIADEPTTALDVTIQAQILDLVQRLCRERGTALIWITHDLAVVSSLAHRLCVMYAGRIIESGPVDQVIDHPRHPYTAGLIASLPQSNRRGQPLAQIPGMTPSLLNLPSGCPFRNRCDLASEVCLDLPIETRAGDRHWRCHHPVGGAS